MRYYLYQQLQSFKYYQGEWSYIIFKFYECCKSVVYEAMIYVFMSVSTRTSLISLLHVLETVCCVLTVALEQAKTLLRVLKVFIGFLIQYWSSSVSDPASYIKWYSDNFSFPL